jgi:hypothetical protein
MVLVLFKISRICVRGNIRRQALGILKGLSDGHGPVNGRHGSVMGIESHPGKI